MPLRSLKQEPDLAEKRVFYQPLCPFSRKIRLILAEKQIGYKAFEEKPFFPSEKLYGVNSEGSVPVFVDSGAVFVRDYAIQEYLEQAYPKVNLLGMAEPQKAETRRLLSWFDGKFYQDVTCPLLEEKVAKRIKKRVGPSSDVLKSVRKHLYWYMGYLDWIMDSRNWLSGAAFSLADLAAGAQISCVDYFGDVPWEKYPQAKTWYMRLKSRPSFRLILMESFVGILPARHYRLLDF